MPPAVSTQDFRNVTPAWLRPAAAGLALFVHLLVLVGIQWPATPHLRIPQPLELQIVAQGRPVEAVSGVDTVQSAEIRPSDALPGAPAAEAQPVAAPETPSTIPTEQAAAEAPATRILPPTISPSRQDTVARPERPVGQLLPLDLGGPATAERVPPPPSEVQTAAVASPTADPPSQNPLAGPQQQIMEAKPT